MPWSPPEMSCLTSILTGKLLLAWAQKPWFHPSQNLFHPAYNRVHPGFNQREVSWRAEEVTRRAVRRPILRTIQGQMEGFGALVVSIFPIFGYGSVPINTIFSGMDIHLPAILGFTRYQGFDPSPYQYTDINALNKSTQYCCETPKYSWSTPYFQCSSYVTSSFLDGNILDDQFPIVPSMLNCHMFDS
jgi:hypothetical protein